MKGMKILFQFSPKSDTLDQERIADEIEGMGGKNVTPLFTKSSSDLLCSLWSAQVRYENYEAILGYLEVNPLVKYAEFDNRM